jgi:predicted HicB family RNase H-like nuclease
MNEATKKRREKYICSEIRFSSKEDHELVKRAAANAGLSMNAWLLKITLRTARKELTAN